MLRSRRFLSASLGVTSVALGSRWLNGETVNDQTKEKKKRIVIIGGGAAGISVSAHLCRDPTLDVVVVEPSKDHYYQPVKNNVFPPRYSTHSRLTNLSHLIFLVTVVDSCWWWFEKQYPIQTSHERYDR